MSPKYKILIFDNESIILKSCFMKLIESGYEVCTVQSSRIAPKMVKEEIFDLIILDLNMLGIEVMQLLRIIKNIRPNIDVIIITVYSSIENFIESIKLGAINYIQKSFTPDELFIKVKSALDKKESGLENINLCKGVEENHKFLNKIGKSKKKELIFQTIAKGAPTDSTILIYGESGTGKEILTKAIHNNSLRNKNPFVSIDCNTLSENLLESELFGHIRVSFIGAISTKLGLFQIADGGTIFWDEISDIDPSIYEKLLKVLQEKEIKPIGSTETIKVDTRKISATNKNIEELVKKGKFRDDLFYRLNMISIQIPPLRKRKEDIPLLILYFLKKFNLERKKNIKNFSNEALKLFVNYDWLGNVRALENTIERIVVLSDNEIIRPINLPSNIKGYNLSQPVNVPLNSKELKKIKKQIRRKFVINIKKIFILEALKIEVKRKVYRFG